MSAKSPHLSFSLGGHTCGLIFSKRDKMCLVGQTKAENVYEPLTSSCLPPHSLSVAVRAGKLWESEGVLSEGPEPPERPLQGHVPSRHRLLSPGWLRMCPTLPAWRQKPRTHRWEWPSVFIHLQSSLEVQDLLWWWNNVLTCSSIFKLMYSDLSAAYQVIQLSHDLKLEACLILASTFMTGKIKKHNWYSSPARFYLLCYKLSDN